MLTCNLKYHFFLEITGESSTGIAKMLYPLFVYNIIVFAANSVNSEVLMTTF